MQLSVIIVNYNVKYFIEHCLRSVERAAQGMQVETIVVDNQSSDGSVEMIRQRFPWVKLMANADNVGFAKANNQGVAVAKGAYILYLNPDTILPEDALRQCYDYMEAHPEAGALGCRLVDGKGQFLPESKRGFPSARVAFFKICGLSSIFKRSAFFNRYHLGYLSEHEVHEVDVLVGCFMFCRRSVIEQVGSFDEEYFMYGEDIDLSYKVIRGGFRNVYFPHTTVIHYKGESTNKGSLNYVKMFYQAMIIFARKHFNASQKGMYVALIQFAIYMRAVLAFVSRVFSLIRLPLLDAGLLLLSLLAMKSLWIRNVKTETTYAPELITAFFSAYLLIWITSLYVNGGYDRPYKASRVLRGMLIGGLSSVALYGLLPETLRFSRGITVLGALSGTLLILASRRLLQALGVKSAQPDRSREQKVLLVAEPGEEEEIRRLLAKAEISKHLLGSVNPGEEAAPGQLGAFRDLPDLCRLYRATEVIYAQGALSFAAIIASMQELGPDLDYKLHATGSDSIIGSNSKNTAGDLYTTERTYRIGTPEARRNRRVLDLLASLTLLILSPLLIGFTRRPAAFLSALLAVLFGQKTFVGYSNPALPALRPFLLTPYPETRGHAVSAGNREHLETLYALHYNTWDDVRVIREKWRMLGAEA